MRRQGLGGLRFRGLGGLVRGFSVSGGRGVWFRGFSMSSQFWVLVGSAGPMPPWFYKGLNSYKFFFFFWGGVVLLIIVI